MISFLPYGNKTKHILGIREAVNGLKMGEHSAVCKRWGFSFKTKVCVASVGT